MQNPLPGYGVVGTMFVIGIGITCVTGVLIFLACGYKTGCHGQGEMVFGEAGLKIVNQLTVPLIAAGLGLVFISCFAYTIMNTGKTDLPPENS